MMRTLVLVVLLAFTAVCIALAASNHTTSFQQQQHDEHDAEKHILTADSLLKTGTVTANNATKTTTSAAAFANVVKQWLARLRIYDVCHYIWSQLAKHVPRLFYLVNPYEYMAPDHDIWKVGNYIVEATPIFIAAIMLEFIYLRITGKTHHMDLSDGITSANNGAIAQLTSTTFHGVTFLLYMWVYDNYHIVELPWNSAWTWIIGFLARDVSYYFFHRYAHEVNFLWAQHVVHHSSEFFNLFTALRQSILQQYFGGFFNLPFAFFVPPAVMLVHYHFNNLYQFWIHAALVPKLGPLEWILNTPSHHRVHHGSNRYCIDKNYGGTLIIWDRLFGTFAAEDEEVVYGLTHNINTFDVITAQTHHLTHMWNMIKQHEGIANKLAVIWKGPGWAPGKPRLGDPEDIPDVHAPVKRYSKPLPFNLSLYALIQSISTVFLAYSMIMHQRELPRSRVLLGYAFAVWQYLSAGFILEQMAIARAAETIRLFTMTVIGMYCVASKDVNVHPLYFQIEPDQHVILDSAVTIFFLLSMLVLPFLGPWKEGEKGFSIDSVTDEVMGKLKTEDDKQVTPGFESVLASIKREQGARHRRHAEQADDETATTTVKRQKSPTLSARRKLVMEGEPVYPTSSSAPTGATTTATRTSRAVHVPATATRSTSSSSTARRGGVPLPTSPSHSSLSSFLTFETPRSRELKRLMEPSMHDIASPTGRLRSKVKPAK